MGLRQRLVSAAVSRAHVLVVETPGSWRTRVAAERAVESRGWSLATSPADADVLLVCGAPDADLAAAIDQVWAQLPGPRARSVVADGQAVDDCLDKMAVELSDATAQVADAVGRPASAAGLDPADHGEMDHGDMAPAGVALAEGGPDRDGLDLDVLHVTLGPVLSHWPPGLVLTCAMQGDVVVHATAAQCGTGADDPPAQASARRCDRIATLLDLAGWSHAASRARRARDAALEGSVVEARRWLAGVRDRVRRNPVLRWQLSDVGPASLPDVYSLLRQALDEALSDRDAQGSGATPEADLAESLPPLVDGLEMSAVRLVVAALDLRCRVAERVETVHA